jgi:hypothetical protein
MMRHLLLITSVLVSILSVACAFSIEYALSPTAEFKHVAKINNLKTIDGDLSSLKSGILRIGAASASVESCPAQVAQSTLVLALNSNKEHVVGFSYCACSRGASCSPKTSIVVKTPEVAVKSRIQMPGEPISVLASAGATPVGASQQQGQQQGQQQQAEQEPSGMWAFFKRWWYVIVPVMLFMFINSLSSALSAEDGQPAADASKQS